MKALHQSSKTFSAPICLTICGDDVAAYGRPACMVAISMRVTLLASETAHENDETIQKLYSAVYKEIFGTASSVSNCQVRVPLSSSFRSVQSAIIVCLSAYLLDKKLGKPASIHEIQKVAYAVEKGIFQHYSHAQTVASIQGGLIYYRKEFEFYKTIVKLPMKLPEGFLDDLVLIEPNYSDAQPSEYSDTYAIEQEKICKRLIFAITQERKSDWRKSLFHKHILSDLYFTEGNQKFQEDHDGLIQA